MPSKPRVYFRLFASWPGEPTRRRRGVFVCDGLRSLGWDVNNNSPEGCDIAILQRIANPAEVRSHQAAGRLTIFETNDIYLFKGSNFYNAHEAETVTTADYVVVSSRYMAQRYARLNPRTLIAPEILEPEHWSTPRADLPEKPLILSWVGMPDNFELYVAPFLREMGLVKDLRLRVVTTEVDSKRRSNREFAARVPIPTEFVTWNLGTWVHEMAQAHAGLIILPDTEFCRNKGSHKAVSYMALGLPCIASDMPGYREVIKHGETGLLADSPEEFRECIEQLRDPALREKLGTAGRGFSRYFTQEAVGKVWDRLLWSAWEHRNEKAA